MIHLTLLGSDARSWSFRQDLVTIGRNADNILVIADPRISGLHGRILRLHSGEYVYEDMGSTNGSMVRSDEGRERVVDPRQSERVPLCVGDVLVLGDIGAPTQIRVDRIDEVSEDEHLDLSNSGGLESRSIHNASVLSTALVRNPLTSRRVLHEMFELFRQLIQCEARPRVVANLLDFVLKHLAGASLAGLYSYVKEPSSLVCEALRTSEVTSPAVPSGTVLRALFKSVLMREESALVDNARALERAFGSARPPRRTAIAAPIVSGGKTSGLIFVVSSGVFTQFDVDLLTVLSHYGAACLENVSLITRLREAESQLKQENAYLKQALDRSQVSVHIIGQSPVLNRVMKQAEAVARTDTTVLLLGETGTGKELFARYLHEAGPRRDKIFAAVNCGALAETLLESELFGHKRGAFTGAHSDRQGLFQVANGGTLFLDEVGDVSPALQVKLLRALESGEVTPVGAVRPDHVDVRIIAATNKDLQREVQEGNFREDLFYRINVFPLRLPPLRDRTGDLELLVEHFLDVFNQRLEKQITGIDPVALERLRAYTWPGNIRELQNEIERAVLLSDDGETLQAEALSERVSGMVELPVEIGPLKETMSRLEERYILRALKQHGENRTHTARTLGISRQALTVKLSKYGVI